MGGDAAAHAKMHQPLFSCRGMKAVCAVPAMIQCSWRRCVTRRPGTRGAVGLEEGAPGYPEASSSPSRSYSPQTAVGTRF